MGEPDDRLESQSSPGNGFNEVGSTRGKREESKKERKEKNDGGRKCSGDNRPSRVPIDGTQLPVEIVTR